MILVVATTTNNIASFQARLDEQTAGTWRDFVRFQSLQAEKFVKEANNNWVTYWAEQEEVDLVLVAQDLTSTWLTEAYPKIVRCTRAVLNKSINDWVQKHGLSWRHNLEKARRSTPYAWCDSTEWIEQFARVDGERGRRLAKALLQQLRVVNVGELSAWFTCTPSCERNAFFVGSDPHSGDFGLINILASKLSGKCLSDAQKISEIRDEERLMLFSDAAWSGGESVRRLQCIYTKCEKKLAVPKPETRVWLRFAFVTDIAERRLSEATERLVAAGLASESPNVSCPEANRLTVASEGESKGGLAFALAALRKFVDSSDDKAMRAVTLGIGKQLAANRPLGTQEIASTIAFWHSLPRAMLPVFIVNGKAVTGADGTTFAWKALIRSKHLSDPGKDDKSVYCGECALNT